MLNGYDVRNESKSFLLTLKSLSNIPKKDINVSGDVPPAQGAKYSVEYYVTLFNKELGGSGNFYGRTYRSGAIPVRDAGNSWETTAEELIYLNTNYIQKTSFAVAECVIAKEIGGIKSFGSLGYGLCLIFDFSGASTIDLTKGSPRSIGSGGASTATSKSGQGAVRLTFEMRDFPPFERLKLLIPANCFVGMHEVVPGLVSDFIPSPKPTGMAKPKNLELCKSQRMYIHNIEMVCSIAFENRFVNFLKVLKKQKLTTFRGTLSQNENDNVHISERRVTVGVNNTWKNLSDENFIQMGPPNEKGISNSGGSITVNNFYCHQLVAILFRIEYKALILMNNKQSDNMNFTLGWACYLPNLNSMNEICNEQVELDVILGPGKGPTGELLWDPNVDDMNHYKLKLRAYISNSSQAPHSMPQDRAPVALNQPRALAQNPRAEMDPNIQMMQNQAVMEQQRMIDELNKQLQLKNKQEREAQFQLEQNELRNLHQANMMSQGDPFAQRQQ